MFQLITSERQELDMVITQPDGNNLILESIAIFQSPYKCQYWLFKLFWEEM